VTYSKWVVTIPPKYVRKLRWREGEDLKPEIKEGKLIISKT